MSCWGKTLEFFEEIFDVEITQSPNPVANPTNKASPWGWASLSLPSLKKNINLPFYLATTIFFADTIEKIWWSNTVMFLCCFFSSMQWCNTPQPTPHTYPRCQRHRSSCGARGSGEGTAIGASKFTRTSSLGACLVPWFSGKGEWYSRWYKFNQIQHVTLLQWCSITECGNVWSIASLHELCWTFKNLTKLAIDDASCIFCFTWIRWRVWTLTS